MGERPEDDLSAETVAEIARFAEEIVREAGNGIARRFRSRSFSVVEKADGSPVTEADREAEELLRDRIARRFPSHGIIGEEFGTDGGSREFVWVLDPIDGTKSFVHGVPLFGSLIGVLFRGRPVVGAIHQPVLDRFAIGDNRRAWLDGDAATVRPERPLGRATVLCTDPAAPLFAAAGPAFSGFWQEAAIVRSWGDCYGYLLLVAGQADVMIDPVLSPWDLLPLLPILRGAGASVTSVDGRDPVDGGSLLACSCRSLHERALRALGVPRTHG